MKQEQPKKSSAEETIEIIENLPLHKDYKPVPDLPIPLGYGVLIKPITKTIEEITFDSGVTLLTAEGNNTQPKCEGILYAVGPQCSKYMRIGLKYQYSAEVKTSFRHKQHEFMKMDEFSVHFVVPDESTRVDNGIKDSRQVRKEKKLPKQASILNQIAKDEANDMDKLKDRTKGKVRPVSNVTSKKKK